MECVARAFGSCVSRKVSIKIVIPCVVFLQDGEETLVLLFKFTSVVWGCVSTPEVFFVGRSPVLFVSRQDGEEKLVIIIVAFSSRILIVGVMS